MTGTRPAPSGGADARVWQPWLGCSFQVPGRGTPGTVASRTAAPMRCARSYFSEGKGARRPPLATWRVAVGGESLSGAAAGSSAHQGPTRAAGDRDRGGAARGRPNPGPEPAVSGSFRCSFRWGRAVLRVRLRVSPGENGWPCSGHSPPGRGGVLFLS